MAVTNYAALPSIVHAQGSLDGCLSLFLLGGCLGVRLCGMFNTLEPVKLVPEVLYYFMFPQHYVGVPVLPHPCLTLNIVRFFIIIILVSLKWYLVVLICISPMTNDVEDLICCSCFFVKCPNLLPIKKNWVVH